MAYVKIEPTGTCERKGLVQIRLAMYLGPEDYGYDKHHVEIPVIPAEGYTGKVDALGNPLDQEGYDKWEGGLPRVWQNNPFHNHLIYVRPETPDAKVMDIAEAYLHEAFFKWVQGGKQDLDNGVVKFDPRLAVASRARAEQLKTTTAERII